MLSLALLGIIALAGGAVIGILTLAIFKNVHFAPWSGGLIATGLAFLFEPLPVFLLGIGVVTLVLGLISLSRSGGWPLFGRGLLLFALGSLAGWAGVQGLL